MKECRRCQERKELSDFYPHKKMRDGHLNICKECKKGDEKSRYHTNYQDSDWRNTERKRTRERNIRLGYTEKYSLKNKSKEQRARVSEMQKAWAERNPEKVKAQLLAQKAMRDGLIKKEPCSVCGTTKRLEKHHPDYSKPLEIIWLCRKHHGEVHWLSE